MRRGLFDYQYMVITITINSKNNNNNNIVDRLNKKVFIVNYCNSIPCNSIPSNRKSFFSESLGTHVLFEELGNTLISILRNDLSFISN